MPSSAPALFGHCIEVFETLDKAAKDIVLPNTGEEVRVWEGFTTKVFTQLHLPIPYYTSVMDMLKKMDSVRQIRRGGGGSPSQWLILQRPSLEMFDHVRSQEQRIKTGKKDVVAQMLNDINVRLTRVEAWIKTQQQGEVKSA
jgi:hypothetical protein